MKVILHTVNTVKMATAVLDDAPDVAEEVVSALRLKNRCAVFGGEHDVIGEGGVG